MADHHLPPLDHNQSSSGIFHHILTEPIIRHLDSIKELVDDDRSSTATLTPSTSGECVVIGDLIDLDTDGVAPPDSGRPPPGYDPTGNGYFSDQEEPERVRTVAKDDPTCSSCKRCLSFAETGFSRRSLRSNSSMSTFEGVGGKGDPLAPDSGVSSSDGTAPMLNVRRSGGVGGRILQPYSNSRRSSFNSDMEMYTALDAEVYSELSELSTQVKDIQSQISNIAENSLDDKHVRLKQDNAVLNERLRILEDQLHVTESRWKQRFEDEKKRHMDLTARIEREKYLESETMSLKLQLIQREHGECEKTREKNETEISTLKGENKRMAEKIEDLEYQLDSLAKDHSDATDRLRGSYKKVEKELEGKNELIAGMQAQLDDLKPLIELRQRRGSTWESREGEMQGELERLKEENKSLSTNNEDLQAQLLQASMIEGRSLLAGGGTSLADEMGEDTRAQVPPEVMQALRDQEVTNQKLRAYIDGILLRIVEMYPAILEIQTDEDKLTLQEWSNNSTN